MATDPKLRSITGRLVPNKLTSREDDYTFNTQYVGTRTIDDICKLAQPKMGEKYSASEMRTLYDVLLATAKTELFGGATVEFGFTNNSVGVEGSFVGPSAQFDPNLHAVVLRSTPTAAIRKELSQVTAIVSHIEEGLPTISTVTDVATGSVNKQLTPGGGLNGKGTRVKIVGEEGQEVGFFFVNAETQAVTVVPQTSLLRNEPKNFSFVIPPLADGTYYLEIASQYGGNSAVTLKEVRRNRFPYPLTVGSGGSGGGSEDNPEII